MQAQLDTESKRFCNEKRNVDYDPATKTVKLSMIFKWYKDDFGGSNMAVIDFINKYRADNAKLPPTPRSITSTTTGA